MSVELKIIFFHTRHTDIMSEENSSSETLYSDYVDQLDDCDNDSIANDNICLTGGIRLEYKDGFSPDLKTHRTKLYKFQLAG